MSPIHRLPLPHDPPAPPGYVDPLADSDVLTDLHPAAAQDVPPPEADSAASQA